MQRLEKAGRELLAGEKHRRLLRMQFPAAATGRLEKVRLAHAAWAMNHQRRKFAKPGDGHLDRRESHPIAGSHDEVVQLRCGASAPVAGRRRCSGGTRLPGCRHDPERCIRIRFTPPAGRLNDIGPGHRLLPDHTESAAEGFADNRLEFAAKRAAKPFVGHSLPRLDHHLPLAGSSPHAQGRLPEPDPEPLVTDPAAEGIPHALGERWRFHGRNGNGFTHGSFLPAGRILGRLRSILVVPHPAHAMPSSHAADSA